MRREDQDRRDPREIWKELNEFLFEKEGINREEFAKKSGIPKTTLSTVIGGRELLSLKQLTRLVRCHIQLGGIRSGSKFQEYLDVLKLCSGYDLDGEQEEEMRKVAEDELKKKGIVTKNAIYAVLAKLEKGVRALSSGEFASLERDILQGDTERPDDSRFQSLIIIFHRWRGMR